MCLDVRSMTARSRVQGNRFLGKSFASSPIMNAIPATLIVIVRPYRLLIYDPTRFKNINTYHAVSISFPEAWELNTPMKVRVKPLPRAFQK